MRHALSEEQWERIEGLLPAQAGYAGKATDNRRFVNAVVYVAKTGIPWRELPQSFGQWNSVYVRFSRWAKKAVWQKVFEALPDDDLKVLLLDSTVIRVHQHGAGAPKKGETDKVHKLSADREAG